MRLITTSLILALIFWSPLGNAQQAIISEIRQHYQWVNEGIEDAMRPNVAEKGVFFSNELTINAHGNAWPGVGQYQSTAIFWYDREPAIARLNQTSPVDGLYKVILSNNIAMETRHTEFLYQGGQLVFVFSRELGEEIRVYYASQKPVRFMRNENSSDMAAVDESMIQQAAAYLDQAQQFQNMFLASFAESY